MPDAEERCGYTRDDLLRSVLIVVAFLPTRRRCDAPGPRLRTAGADPVRDWLLWEFRLGFLADDEPAPQDVREPDRAAADRC